MTESDILNKLEHSVLEASENVKKFKSNNNKKKCIMNLKIFNKILKSAVPYVLVTTSVIGIYKMLGLGYPFIMDDMKVYAKRHEFYDENHNLQICYEYDNCANDNYLIHTSEWSKDEFGIYTRTTNKYPISYFDDETILQLLNGDYRSIMDYLGRPFSTEIEQTNRIEENKEILSVMIYDEFKNEYKYIEETVTDNVLSTILIVISIIFFNVIAMFVNSGRQVTLGDEINSIKDKYKLLESDDILLKKLEIRKNNYDFLGGKNDEK